MISSQILYQLITSYIVFEWCGEYYLVLLLLLLSKNHASANHAESVMMPFRNMVPLNHLRRQGVEITGDMSAILLITYQIYRKVYDNKEFQ